MTEIEKMKKYIERTKLDKNDRFCLSWPEAVEMSGEAVQTKDAAFRIITLAFNYGKAKGYRAAKAEGRATV